MIRYEYLCTQRPPMPGTVPQKGLVDTRDPMDGVDNVTINNTVLNCWGFVIYDRPLTDREMSDYGLRFMATHHSYIGT